MYKGSQEAKEMMNDVRNRKKLTDKQKSDISSFQKQVVKTEDWNNKNSLSHLGKRNPMFQKKTSETQKKAVAKANELRMKDYSFLDPKGNLISFTGLALFCRKNNLHAGSMSQLNNGIINSHKGWQRPN